MSEKKWSVKVEVDGEFVLCLESDCLSGKDMTDEEKEIVRECATHLLAFVGAKDCKCGASLTGKSTICEACANDAEGFI